MTVCVDAGMLVGSVSMKSWMLLGDVSGRLKTPRLSSIRMVHWW